ncbi:unnamed protein product [Caenorhabditis auriculariae]|uniref:TLC domain-containing protein n=1 Tax=Caenorhabditis auriculariae TaxID=2777116 RepID=A0A8S1HRY5_9PELO|nr:unnamed protein product [Caenorhabditis auriculariae]
MSAFPSKQALALDAVRRAPFHFFQVDNFTDLGINDGSELRAPSYWVLWYAVNTLVTIHCWTSWQEGIKRKRLINVTTSLIHSTISGLFIFAYFFMYTKLVFASPLHYYSYLDSQIVMLSIGYFFYDAFDLLLNDKLSIATGVLLFHHAASILVLSTAVLSHKFLLYAYWALLMEVSSVLLHSRSLLHLSKLSTTSMIGLSRVVAYFNIVFFVIFRFLVQVFLVGWAWVNLDHMHSAFAAIALVGGLCFFVINVGLFMRILHSDGFFLPSVMSEGQLDALLEDNDYSKVGTSEKEDLLEV